MNRIIWDQSKCTGCRVCEAVCSVTKEGEFSPAKARGKLVRTIENAVLHKIRVYCLQCENPNCMAVCPAGAIVEDEQGIKSVDEEKCLGCKMCEIACPVGAITVNSEKGVSIKCDLCKGLEEPMCVKYCYTGALQYIQGEKAGFIFARAKSDKFLEMQEERGTK